MDPWKDRIALNPSMTPTESAGSHGSSAGGSLDSGGTGETASIMDVTATKERKAPENPPATWSADNPY
jgi:hypothetical protein